MLYRLLFLLLLAPLLAAQGLLPLPSGEIAQRLAHLGNTGSVLYIAAHPDDENTALLAYCARGLGLRTAYLSLTRGDGGQNLIGNEQGEDLGLLRTYELLAARRIDGAEQFFTRAYDFGYTKSPYETFRFWNHDTLLADVVSIIRQFKPDVIITRFPVTGEGGHGQHTASAILANEAFAAAASPTYNPGNNGGLPPWQAEAIYWDAWPPMLTAKGLAADTLLQVNTNVLDPARGKTYTEIAAESRSMHKCQGMGVTPNRAAGMQYLVLTGGTTTELFSKGKRVPPELHAAITACAAAFNPLRPAASLAGISALRAALQAAGLQRQAEEAGRLLLACAGIELFALAGTHTYTAGDTLILQAGARSEVPATVRLISPARFAEDMQLLPRAYASSQARYVVPTATATDNPYWLTGPRQGAFYATTARMEPAGEPVLSARFSVVLGIDTIPVTLPVSYRWNDQAEGEQFRQASVVPAVSVVFTDPLIIARPGKPFTVALRVEAFRDSITAEVFPGSLSGVTFSPASRRVLLRAGVPQVCAFTASPMPGAAPVTLTARVVAAGTVHSATVKQLHYPHIPYLTRLQPATAAIMVSGAACTAKRIAYIPGSGDLVPAVLAAGGIPMHILSEDITARGLQPYDAVILGVRALNTRPLLRKNYGALLEYVRAGGTLLVQYQVAQDPLPDSLGPYPFRLTPLRVTDETAAVTMAPARHQLFTTPNSITPGDFDGWVQERGLYFVGAADPRYVQPLVMNDPGEPSNTGSLLYTRYGKGVFIYTSLAFFRQLPAGVQGAYKLFLNLLSAK